MTPKFPAPQLRLSAIALSLALTSIAFAQNSENTTEQGVAAFNEGRYETALQRFRSAQSAGDESLSLQYNVAVTLYRLGRYDESHDAFTELEGHPDWRVLVNYNYGLLYQAMGQPERARMYFELSTQQQENTDIRRLARNRLDALERRRSGQPERSTADEDRNWLAFATLSAGQDSNATSISDDLVQDTESAEDSYSEALVYGQVYLNGSRNDGLKLYGLSFSRLFNSFDNLDTLLYGGGLDYEYGLGDYNAESGLRLTQTRLDGEKVTDELRLSQSLRRALAIGTVTGTYEYSLFNAGSQFEQVDGDRHRVELDWRKRISKPLLLRLRYRHDINDREDLQRGAAFSSYSPTRDSLMLALNWQVMPKLDLSLQHEFIDSSYDGTNNLRDSDGTVRTQQRDNDRQVSSLTVEYRLTGNWRLNAKAERTESDDNYMIYTYDKTRLQAGINYVF